MFSYGPFVMTPANAVYIGLPHDLEAKLTASVAEIKRQDPLAPVLVLVPNQAAALHVSALITAKAAVIGVSVTTLEAAAREISERARCGAGLELPAGSERLVAAALLSRTGEFLEYASRPGFLRGLGATLRDLLDADLDAEVVEGATGNLERLLGLHKANLQLREELGIDDDSARISAAIRALKGPTPGAALSASGACEVLVFGVYDPTGLQAQFVMALAKAALRFTALLPGHTFAGYFGRRLCDSLSVVPETLSPSTPQGVPTDLAALREAWCDESGTTRPSFARDGSAEVLALPDGVAGARLMAREVLELLRQEQLDPRDLLIVSRGDGGMSSEQVGRELKQLGVPVEGRGVSLGESRVGRPLLALADVLASPRVSRGRLLDVLSDWPWHPDGVAFGEEMERVVIDADELGRWDRISREANLRLLVASPSPSGKAEAGDPLPHGETAEEVDLAGEIQKRLSYEAHRRKRAASQAEERQDPSASGLMQSASSTVHLAGAVRRVAKLQRDLTRGMSWRDAAGRIRNLLESWCDPNAPGLVDWLARLGSLGKLDKLGVEARGTRLVWILRGLSSEVVRDTEIRREGVRLAALARMRGARPKVVILLNGIESCFPRPPAPDALLPPRDRDLLAPLAPTLQRHELDEERALFGELLAMPTQKLILVTTFAGLETGKGTTPSRFLLNALGVLSQGPEPSTEQVAAGDGGVRKVPLQEAWTQTPLDAPDEELRVLGSLDAGLSDGFQVSELRSILGRARPEIHAKLAMEIARLEQPGQTHFDGELGADVVAKLRVQGSFRGAAPGAERGVPLSVSRLETFAECGMKSFLTAQLGLREHERPEDSRGIDASERGRRVHEILEVFGVKSAEAGLLPWRPKGTPRHRELLEDSIGEVIERVLRSAPASQRNLWEAERLRYSGLLRRWLRGETSELADPDWMPIEFEWEFEGQRIELEDGGAPLWYRGRVDRVDLATSQGGTRTVRIVDYKTGSSRDYYDDVTDSGRNLQLYLYGIAAERKFGAATSAGTYDFVFSGSRSFWSGTCEHRKPSAAKPKETAHTALRQVAALVNGMEAGHFAPIPRAKGKPDDGPCTFCSMAEACGPWRSEILAARELDDPVGMGLLDALENPDLPGPLPEVTAKANGGTL